MSETLGGDVTDGIKGAATYAEINVAIRNMNKVNKRIDDLQRLLVSLLENKPFGLPLTKDEKEWLRVCAKPAKESDLAKKIRMRYAGTEYLIPAEFAVIQ